MQRWLIPAAETMLSYTTALKVCLVHGPKPSASPGKWLEQQIHGLHPRPTDTQPKWMEPRSLCSNKLSGWTLHMLRFRSYYWCVQPQRSALIWQTVFHISTEQAVLDHFWSLIHHCKMQMDDLNQYCFFLALVISQFSSEVYSELIWTKERDHCDEQWKFHNLFWEQMCALFSSVSFQPHREWKQQKSSLILARLWLLGLFHFGTWLCSFIIQETICRMSQISAYLNNLIRLIFFPNGQRFLLISVPRHYLFLHI